MELIEECPPETWRIICRRAVEDALTGDRHARDWLALARRPHFSLSLG